MNKQNIILFDFDGVIADTFDISYAINRRLVPELTMEAYRSRFDGNINETHVARFDEAERAESESRFFSMYAPELMKKAVISGMPETVKRLAGIYRLCVISSTHTDPIREFLRRNGLLDCFYDILGNDVERSKVVKVRMVLDKYEIPSAHCLFVTDTLGDIREAEKCGVCSVGVSWGYQSVQTLATGNPYKIVHEPEELAATIDEYFAKHHT